MDRQVAELLALLLRHKGKIVGVLFGLLLGWITIAYGFWKAVFVGILVALGYLWGSRVDNKESIQDLFNRLMPPPER